MFDLKTLLLPVDFSERSLEAARQAKAIASHFHSRLIVLNVAEEGARTDLQFEAGGSSAEELQSYLNRNLRETPVEYLVEEGDPAPVIVQRARTAGADLIVMAGHNRGPFETFAFGSVTGEVLSAATCPVWVSLHEQKGPAPLFRRILCSVALSDSSGDTLEWAMRFADAFQATCDVIHVSESSGGRDEGRITEDSLVPAERAGLDRVRRKLGTRGQVILAAGGLGKAVYAAATERRSDLLVVGRSQTESEIAHVHSATYTLAHDVPCPIVSI